MPTLEDLRESEQAAWLWDAARGRAVWANAAGLAFFGCETLFDLIDRPFDLQEPGIQRIAALARHLQRGKPSQTLLAFPSAGMADPVACQCYLHALPDGRTGILAVQRPDVQLHEAPAPDELVLAFDAMPMPALLATTDGDIRHSNEAARAMLPSFRLSSLGSLIGDEPRAAELMLRLQSAGTVSFIERLATRNGQRDIRLTLKRSGPAGGTGPARVLILLDDVTVRRALERQLHPKDLPPGETRKRMSPEEEAAFLALGKRLNGEAAPEIKPQPVEAKSPPADTIVAPAPKLPTAPSVAPIPPVAAVAPVAPSAEARSSGIPAFLSAAIDSRPGGQVVVKDGAVIYANAEALRALGFSDLQSMAAAPELTQALADASRSANGPSAIAREASVTHSQIPWQNGPADCYSLIPRQIPPAADHPAPPNAVEDVPRPTAQAASRLAEMLVVPATRGETAPELPPTPPPATPQRQTEAADEELRAILDTASDGIITLDDKGRIRSFSAGAEAIFGYRTAEVADKPFADLLAPESRKMLRDYLAALQGPGLAAVFNDGREVSAVVKQGGEVPLFMTIGRLQKSGAKAAFCAVVRDITQWKRTEQELREAKDNAEQASRQKSEFLAQISHELRTPLNAILGFSEVMRLERFGEIRNEKYRGYINDIHTSGAHLLSLINDLLDLSKVEAGKLELNFTAVNLADTADHAIRLTQDLATSGRVIVRKSFPPGLPNVVADQRSMRQIMLNLLSNAIKFTDPGGQVIVSAQTSPSGELKLRVKDTGIGMTAPELKEAMEPFRRVVTDGRDRQGTGLGLPLTKALAEANRTGFAISSEPRKGTLVEITFPVTRVLAE